MKPMRTLLIASALAFGGLSLLTRLTMTNSDLWLTFAWEALVIGVVANAVRD